MSFATSSCAVATISPMVSIPAAFTPLKIVPLRVFLACLFFYSLLPSNLILVWLFGSYLSYTVSNVFPCLLLMTPNTTGCPDISLSLVLIVEAMGFLF